jgi:hypothetical protein
VCPPPPSPLQARQALGVGPGAFLPSNLDAQATTLKELDVFAPNLRDMLKATQTFADSTNSKCPVATVKLGLQACIEGHHFMAAVQSMIIMAATAGCRWPSTGIHTGNFQSTSCSNIKQLCSTKQGTCTGRQLPAAEMLAVPYIGSCLTGSPPLQDTWIPLQHMSHTPPSLSCGCKGVHQSQPPPLRCLCQLSTQHGLTQVRAAVQGTTHCVHQPGCLNPCSGGIAVCICPCNTVRHTYRWCHLPVWCGAVEGRVRCIRNSAHDRLIPGNALLSAVTQFTPPFDCRVGPSCLLSGVTLIR